MQTMKLAVLAWLALFCSLAFSSAGAACLKVADDPDLKINAQAASNFQNELGIDRAGLFAALNEISQTETGGCWATPTGDFDGQIVSVGTSQWNYGQKSLQPLLISYKAHFLTQAAFDQDIAKIMPKYGSVIFSKGCLSTNGTGAGGLSVECVTEILGHQHNKNLDADIAAEFEALFNSETMRQIQLDKFIRLMGTIRDDVARTWPGRRPTPVQIQWAIDTKVQQGSLLPDSTVKRLRVQIAQSTPENLKEMELGVVEWYHGGATSFGEDGIKYDVDYNVREWRKVIEEGHLTSDQIELMAFTEAEARVAIGEGGRWQMLAFERRLKIAFGVGSVAGNTRMRSRSLIAS